MISRFIAFFAFYSICDIACADNRIAMLSLNSNQINDLQTYERIVVEAKVFLKTTKRVGLAEHLRDCALIYQRAVDSSFSSEQETNSKLKNPKLKSHVVANAVNRFKAAADTSNVSSWITGFRTDDSKAREHLQLDNTNAFVTALLPAVVVVAHRYQNLGLEVADLIEEGVKGLVVAANNLTNVNEKGLSTYLNKAIRTSIKTAIKEKSEREYFDRTAAEFISLQNEESSSLVEDIALGMAEMALYRYLGQMVKSVDKSSSLAERELLVSMLFYGFFDKGQLETIEISHLLGIGDAEAQRIKDFASQRSEEPPLTFDRIAEFVNVSKRTAIVDKNRLMGKLRNRSFGSIVRESRSLFMGYGL